MSKNGFTLIELLVVIVIISILALVGAAMFNNVQNSAQDARRKADIQAIAQAMEAHYDPVSGKYSPLDATWFADGIIPKDSDGSDYPTRVGNSSNGYNGFIVCTSLEVSSSCTESSQIKYDGPPIATPTPTPTSAPTSSPTSSPTSAPGPVFLGNPTKDRFPLNNDNDEYARNPWDLMVYNNRVYIGSGNSSNYAPRSNAGPVDLWYYDTSTNAFVKDTIVGANCGTTCVDDEQIDIYRLIDGVLYTPGHDPKNNGAGDFYRMEGTSWKAYHNSQLNYHDYDIYKFGSRLFISGSSSNTASSAVSYSDDNGTTWQVMNCQNEGSTTVAKCNNSARAWRMFELGGILFVNWPGVTAGSNLSKYDPVNNLFINLAWSTSYPFYPTLPTCTSAFGCERNGAQTVRPVNFNGNTVYIAAKNVNDHQWDPYPNSLLKATALNNAIAITLPGIAAGWKPWDITIDGSTMYVLVSAGSAGSFTNYVFSSTDLNTWTEVLRFNHETFARSFEYLSPYFYFGMGTSEVTPLADSTGDIIRYPYP